MGWLTRGVPPLDNSTDAVNFHHVSLSSSTFTGEDMRDTTEYNGWTNYATWLINLELDLTDDPNDKYHLEKGMSAHALGQQIKEYVREDVLNMDSLSEIMYSIVGAFLSDVDWTEIAEHVIDEGGLDEVDDEEEEEDA